MKHLVRMNLLIAFLLLLVSSFEVSGIELWNERSLQGLHEIPSDALSVSGTLRNGHKRPMEPSFPTRNGASCQWDVYSDSCVLSSRSIVRLLLQSKSELARTYAPFLAEAEGLLLLQDHEFSQLEKEHLSIDAVLEAHNTSSCYKNASTMLKLETAQNKCQKLATESLCSADVYCTWIARTDLCALNSWKSFYNVSTIDNVPVGLKQVLSMNSRKWTDSFRNEFGSSNTTVDWESVLNWQGPDFICPSNVSEIVCLFVEPLVETFGKSLYCSGKYHNIFKLHLCNNDHYCETSIDPDLPSCVPRFHYYEAARVKSQEIFINHLDNPFLQDFFRTSDRCRRRGSGYNCYNEECLKNRDMDVCVPGPQWMVSRMVQHHPSDALCRVFSIAKATRCLKQPYSFLCHSSCVWDTRTSMCRPSPDAYLKRIWSEDHLLKKSFAQDHAHCSKLSHRTCKRMTSVV